MNFLNLNKIYTFQIALDGTVMLLSTIWVIIRNLQNYFKPRQDKTRIISLAKQTNIHTKNKQTDIQKNKQTITHKHKERKKERKKETKYKQTNIQTNMQTWHRHHLENWFLRKKGKIFDNATFTNTFRF